MASIASLWGAQGHALTLPEAVDQALTNNPGLRSPQRSDAGHDKGSRQESFASCFLHRQKISSMREKKLGMRGSPKE